MNWKDDVQTVLERDPAARSFREAFYFSPGLHAIILQRIEFVLNPGKFRVTHRTSYLRRGRSNGI